MASRTVDGQRVSLTNVDKVLYPQSGTTKSDVIDYYAAIAPAMLPHLRDRIVTRKRWPNGVDHPSFFEKNVPETAPEWLGRHGIRHSSRVIEYAVISSAAELVLMGQLAALELHVPQWTIGAETADTPGRTDRIVFDLDPGEGTSLDQCAQVALAIREMLGAVGLSTYPVTSGSKGLHVYASLDQPVSSEDASQVARQVAGHLREELPDLVITTMRKSDRPGKVFVDWSQNNAAKTTICPYSLRGRDEPTVAAPRYWDELESSGLRQLGHREVLDRFAARGDPMADVLGALGTYRAKRDPRRTPEPVPRGRSAGAGDAEGRSAGAGPTSRNELAFVVQEHHARRLHWDFRLEREGVLVSWAVPKGLPTDPGRNHLAVHTEDHPMEYATFAGTIPRGEYGGGTVEIWDSGTYRPIKWRPGEVIVELSGERATGQFALIRTKGDDWLMHKIAKGKEKPVPGGGENRATRRKAPTSGSAAPPSGLLPMLPTLTEPGELGRLRRDEWAFEGKWDGVRVLAEAVGGVVRLTSRKGNDVSGTYPELAQLPRLLDGHDAILDGEVVALDERGVPSFSLLQSRMGVTAPGQVRRAAARQPVVFYAFDVLYADGTDLLATAYRDRRRVLEALTAGADPTGVLRVPEALDGSPDEALAESRRLGWEGIVAKRLDASYRPGRRERAWLKIKNQRAQEVVIGGWRRGQGSRAGTIGSLLLGIPDEERLRYVGRVGTGFTERALRDLASKLRPLVRKTSPFAGELDADQRRDAVWVTPRLVGEVSYSEWTHSGHLRHPVWRGLRPDKAPDEVVPE